MLQWNAFNKLIHETDEVFVIEKVKEEPAEMGWKFWSFISKPPPEVTKVSKSKALAYILDRSLTKVDYEETCRLVNKPGQYIIPSYSVLDAEKQKNRPAGKHLKTLLLPKSKLSDSSASLHQVHRKEWGNDLICLQVDRFLYNPLWFMNGLVCRLRLLTLKLGWIQEEVWRWNFKAFNPFLQAPLCLFQSQKLHHFHGLVESISLQHYDGRVGCFCLLFTKVSAVCLLRLERNKLPKLSHLITFSTKHRDV